MAWAIKDRLSGITAERVRFLFSYKPREGILRWRVKYCKKIVPGAVAGNGARVKFDGVVVEIHRVIWLYMMGEWPPHLVDHKDTNCKNNKWSNLRRATRSQNGMNSKLRSDNKTGCKGVERLSETRYRASISAHGVGYYLGIYPNLEEAIAVRRKAEKKYHGKFARAR